jgi:3-hydroxyisobutyrate dehydrogenase-like beta-hydroxyacid dehydrogenase
MPRMPDSDKTIGVLHPGEMGAALAAVLRRMGLEVLWASTGRSPETRRRAEEAGLRAVAGAEELAEASDLILSVCPPHAAVDVARSAAGFEGIYVDANAIAPATARTVSELIAQGGGRYVDGGIVGPPPSQTVETRLYLSGPGAEEVASLFAGTVVDARVVSERPDAASAVKMAYAAWTKGTAALLLAIRALARAEDVEAVLLDEWAKSLPALPQQSRQAARSAAAKGWRWIAEMEEIAATFAAAGLPGGFHVAAAEVYRRAPRLDEAAPDEATLDRVLAGVST